MLHVSAGRRTPRLRGFALRFLPSAVLALLATAAVQPARSEPPAAVAVAESAVPSTTASPTARIDALHASLLDVMKNAVALGYDGREQKLRTVIPSYFDVDRMAKKALGPHWNRADEDGRRRYLETFTRFTIANYAGRFDGYSGQSFQTLGEEEAPGGTVIVKSQLLDPGEKTIQLNYRMREVAGAWKIIDVYLDGKVSELAVRRSEFVSIVQRENLDALIVALDAKIAKLAAGKES